jgi:hypothetical protein
MFRLTALLALAGVLCLAQSRPAAAKPPKPILPGEDWIVLFDGKTLNGWIEVGKEKWTVEDGTIHGVATTKAYGYLMTEKKYVDFHMSLSFKCEGAGNSGVFFHTEFKPGTPDVSQGLQFEIDCTLGKHTAGIYGDGRQWIVWPAPENEPVVRKGEWNEILLKVEGNRYTARLNGVPMIDFTDPAPRSFNGHIALQLHSGGEGDMRFKNILIRDLAKR